MASARPHGFIGARIRAGAEFADGWRMSRAMITTGDKAPAFDLEDETGRRVRLDELLGEGPVVLFFYPKDSTPGCTVEAGAFAKAYDEFRAAGAQVVGISSDDGSSHRRFKEKCGLPYPLVSDRGGKVRAEYGVPKTLGILPGRVTYVIDRDGTVRHVFNSQSQPDQHPREALKALDRLGPHA
jgi:peroxiredoxin Q/BCP